jgi:hypothetical protein
MQSYALAGAYEPDTENFTSMKLPDNESVLVEKGSAAILRSDILERWPCCYSNTVHIDNTILKTLGKEQGEKFLAQGDTLFSNVVQARRQFLTEKNGTPPPVLVWNWGTSDGVTYGGAQKKTFESLCNACGPDNVWSSYHMAFMMRKHLPPAMSAAPFADAATRSFVQLMQQGTAVILPSKTAGFWSRFHGLADMSAEELAIVAAQSHDFFVELGRAGGKCVCVYIYVYYVGLIHMYFVYDNVLLLLIHIMVNILTLFYASSCLYLLCTHTHTHRQSNPAPPPGSQIRNS